MDDKKEVVVSGLKVLCQEANNKVCFHLPPLLPTFTLLDFSSPCSICPSTLTWVKMWNGMKWVNEVKNDGLLISYIMFTANFAWCPLVFLQYLAMNCAFVRVTINPLTANILYFLCYFLPRPVFKKGEADRKCCFWELCFPKKLWVAGVLAESCTASYKWIESL